MKTILAIILAIYVAGAAGAEGAGSSPAPGTSGKQDQLIDQLLTDSGMKRALQRLPTQIAYGLMQTAMKSEPSANEQRELVKAMKQAFPQDVFVDHASAALKKNYDAQRYAHFVQLLSTPLARRMNDLEAQQPNPSDVQAFLGQVAKRPLPPARIKLIQRIDTASQASALLTKMTIASIEAGEFAARDDCIEARAKVRKMIAKSRPEIEKANRSNAQIALAFTYRDVSDADLDAYAKMYEDKDSIWVQDIAQAAIEEQFKSSMEQGARAVKKVVQAHKRKKTMFAPKCGESESPNEDEPVQEEQIKDEPVKEKHVEKAPASKAAAPESKIAVPDSRGVTADSKVAEPASKAVTSDVKVAALDQKVAAPAKPIRRVHHYANPETDLRDCLRLATSAKIIACAEK